MMSLQYCKTARPKAEHCKVVVVNSLRFIKIEIQSGRYVAKFLCAGGREEYLDRLGLDDAMLELGFLGLGSRDFDTAHILLEWCRKNSGMTIDEVLTEFKDEITKELVAI